MHKATGPANGDATRGRVREPWTGEAIGPAGGVRASITDLARLCVALLDGTAPGIGALDPVADLGRRARIGAAWITIDVDERPVTWHNGGTGGFRSWLGLDRAAGTGAVLVSGASAPVDRHGFTLLAELGPGRGPGAGRYQPPPMRTLGANEPVVRPG